MDCASATSQRNWADKPVVEMCTTHSKPDALDRQHLVAGVILLLEFFSCKLF
jgi:hypothetical protein